MKNLGFIISVVLVWSLSLINTSGLGLAYDTPTKTNWLILLWCLLIVRKSDLVRMLEMNIALILGVFISFILLPLFTSGSWDGLSYLTMIPLVYCFSKLRISSWAFQLSGYIIAGLGLFILFVYSRTSILEGWNDNHISMIGLFSYLYYSISLYGKMTGKKLTIGIAISILYVTMLNGTNSRSAMIFIVFALLLAYRGELFRKLLAKRKFVFIAVNIPLIISLLFIFFPDLFIFQYFEEWSMDNYGKSAFNGRDELWMEAYEGLSETYYLGVGEFLMNHHNSAVAVLSVFGILGYICWYKLLAKPITYVRRFINDNLTFGFLASFLLIFWQQSFELGFVHSSPNMIPYMILGLGIARAREISMQQFVENDYTLSEQECEELN